VSAGRRSLGRLIAQIDAQIAPIALSRRAALTTRGVSNSEECGLALSDPFGVRSSPMS
jgi:predicted nucleic acid-binding protein